MNIDEAGECSNQKEFKIFSYVAILKFICIDSVLPIMLLLACIILSVLKCITSIHEKKRKKIIHEANESQPDQTRTESIHSYASQSTATLQSRSCSTITNTFRLQRIKQERELNFVTFQLGVVFLIALIIRLIGNSLKEIRSENFEVLVYYSNKLGELLGGIILTLICTLIISCGHAVIRLQVMYFFTFGKFGKKFVGATEDSEGNSGKNRNRLEQPSQRRRKCTPIPTDYRYVAAHLFSVDEAL